MCSGRHASKSLNVGARTTDSLYCKTTNSPPYHEIKLQPQGHMNVIHLSTHHAERGAARGAFRLHSALLERGVESRVLVQQQMHMTSNVVPTAPFKGPYYTRYRLLRDQVCTFRYGAPWRRQMFSTGLGRPNSFVVRESRKADLVHLHWVCKGFVPIETLSKLKAPILWTLRDMWPFTGGCHYDSGCNRYQAACGACPILNSNNELDLSRKIFVKKRQEWHKLNIVWVGISNWIAQQARLSPIVNGREVHVIPNAIDTALFKITEESKRKRLNTFDERKVIGFASYGAAKNIRKGFTLLVDALKILKTRKPNLNFELWVAGAEDAELRDIDFPAKGFGTIKADDKLVEFYSGLHAFVSASTQEALGNSAIEATSCSVPCITFSNTGTADVVDHARSGWLCDEYNPEALSLGIEAVLGKKNTWERMSLQARNYAMLNFSTSIVTDKYLKLYEGMISKSVDRD